MTSINQLTIAERCAELVPIINDQLDRWLPHSPGSNSQIKADSRSEVDCPAELAEAMRYAVFPGGKRLRPILVLLAAEACGGSNESALPGACAIELVHCYSLVHDDLPAMDDDDLRRGRPTCHKKFGEAGAVLAGDALLTLAFEIVASHHKPSVGASSCCALAAAAGASGMVGGQVDDLAAEGMDRDDATAFDQLKSIHRRKTGALLTASLTLGALAAEANEQDRQALEEYGKYTGLLFQITDDLLDSDGDEKAVGKRVGKDVDKGKLTFPSVLGEEQSRAMARELLRKSCEQLDTLGNRGEPLRQLAMMILERDR